MRSPLSRVATTIVACLLISACGSSTASAPVTSPAGVATITPVPTAPPVAPTPGPTPMPAVRPMNTAIAAGYYHSCAITGGGGVKCWGSLDGGQANESKVFAVSGLASGVSAIAAGEFHTCALTSGGGVKCWGSNDTGELGDGTTADSSIPVDVVGLSSGVTAISAGGSHTCALTSGGTVKCWGNNPFGGLGNGTRTESSVPVDVSGLSSGISAIAVGGLHTCALTISGGVTCWGEGTSDDPNEAWSTVPVDAPDLTSGITAIAAGLYQTCALTMLGGITCWGPDFTAPGGDLSTKAIGLDVSGLAGGVAAIDVEGGNACALTNDARVACWGDNQYGQLGTSTTIDSSLPLPVEVSGVEGVAGVAVGAMHACALAPGGEVKCWGSNGHGQLGSVLPCSSTSVPVDVPLDGDAAGSPAGPESTVIPVGRIDHATGATDVVLRFDRGPDFAVGDLVGELFQPGPEFTLYGDGTIILRDWLAERPKPEGSILRGRPFMIGQLEEAQVQSLLRFALGEGGLGDACERYETQDTDVASVDVFTIRAGGVDKRVENFGSAPFEALYDRLRSFDSGTNVPTPVWAPERYRGNLLAASIFKNIGDGVAPGLAETGTVPWPWPDIAPADFVGLAEVSQGQRVMSAAEAAVLDLSDKGGVVQRVYLVGPDGESIYYFSLWPMSPDETS